MPYATFHLAPGSKKAQWTRMQIAHRVTAVIRCPDCDTAYPLLDYSIETDGRVQPAFECRECPFHEYVVLREWAP